MGRAGIYVSACTQAMRNPNLFMLLLHADMHLTFLSYPKLDAAVDMVVERRWPVCCEQSLHVQDAVHSGQCTPRHLHPELGFTSTTNASKGLAGSYTKQSLRGMMLLF